MNNFYCIKQGNKYVGLHDKDHSYVIGFRSPVQARHVQYNMHPEPDLTLRRLNQKMDVSFEVSLGLRELQVEKQLRSPIVIDPDVILRVPKAPQRESVLNDGGYHLATVVADDFICMPFTHFVGIIIPNDVLEENDDEIFLECDLVEPIFDPDMFQKF